VEFATVIERERSAGRVTTKAEPQLSTIFAEERVGKQVQRSISNVQHTYSLSLARSIKPDARFCHGRLRSYPSVLR